MQNHGDLKCITIWDTLSLIFWDNFERELSSENLFFSNNGNLHEKRKTL